MALRALVVGMGLLCWACGGEAVDSGAGDGGDAGSSDVEVGAGDGGEDADLEVGATDVKQDVEVEVEPGLSVGWHGLAPLGAGPRQETAVVALGGEIYVLGGFDGEPAIVPTVESYDPMSDTWRTRAPLPEALHHINAAAVDGRLWVVGALSGLGFVATGVVLVYEPELDRWEAQAPMPPGFERGASAVGVLGGRIFIGGGRRDGAVADVSVFDTATGVWDAPTVLPEAREHLVGGVVGGRFVVVGGRKGGALSGRVDIWDPASEQWSVGAPMPTPRGGLMGAVVPGGRLVALGGEGNPARADGLFGEVEVYEAASDTWTQLAPMQTPRHGTGAAALGLRVYVPGGATREIFEAVDTHEVLVLEP